MFEGQIAFSVWAESCQTGDAKIGDMPAGSQVEALEGFKTPGDEQKTRIGDIATSSQIELLQLSAILGQFAETRVGDLLAETQIESFQSWHVGRQGVSDADVCDVETAAQIQRLDVGKSLRHIPEAPPQRKDLNSTDASAYETRKQWRIGPSQMQFRLAGAPDGAMIGRLLPRLTNLSCTSTIPHFQHAEYDGQDLWVKSTDMRPVILLLL